MEDKELSEAIRNKIKELNELVKLAGTASLEITYEFREEGPLGNLMIEVSIVKYL